MGILANVARKRREDFLVAVSCDLPTFPDKTIEDYQSAYQKILKNIWDQNPDDVDLARKVLSWIIFTKDLPNLTISIVQGALSLADGIVHAKDRSSIDEQDLLSVCRGLAIIDHETQNMRFVHYTAESYFATTAVQHEDFPKAQEQLAQTCLKWLQSGDRYHRLYHYASRHWGHHAQAVEGLLRYQIEGFMEDSERVASSFELVVDTLPSDWKPPSLTEPEQVRPNPLHVAAYFGLK